jgi:hypothetical protein
MSELVRSSEQSRAWWTVQAHADDWQVETVHEVLLWDDIVRADFARPLLPRLGRAAIAYFDFSVTGTLFRYFRANWRFGLFSLFPPVLLALFAAAAWVSAHFAVGFLGFAGPGGLMVELTVGLTFFFALLRWPGRRWRVQQALEAWIAANDYLHGRRVDIEARLDGFAEVILAPSRQTGVDEIVLVGHSMGAMLALDLVDRALAIDPEFGRRRSSVRTHG